ncbi:MAG TPA: exonuclease domain-containing protein [Xanthobacteraceae bacterium]
MTDEVIELGMVKFCYAEQDEVAAVVDVFTSFNQPSNPTPPEVVDLTGITDEMVSGQRIDPDAVVSFAADANVVIAHHANFDRKLPSAAGRSSSKSTGPVLHKRLSGESTDSTGRG